MQNPTPTLKNQYQYQEYLPINDDILEKRLKSPNWNVRKEAYQQILYLIKEQQSNTYSGSAKSKVYEIGGRQYTIKKFITMFEDIVEQEHPLVLVIALQCVEVMIERKLCSGRQFVKLTDQGFDKFPLRTSRGKEILQKFADIIEKISLQQQFLMHKLSNYSAHEKCTIFALQVVSMLGMVQLLDKVKQIAHKHPKNAVRQVANQICQQLQQLQNQAQNEIQQGQSEQIQGQQNNKKLGNKNRTEHLTFNNTPQKAKKPTKSKPTRKTPTKQSSNQIQSNSFTRNQMDILQKVPQYQQLPSKQQQKYSQMLLQLIQKYFNKIKQGKPTPQLPMNQLSNISYVIRIMVQSNNAIIYTSGLKILKILTESNCPLIPRSYLLLFIFQKFRLHATHQINQLLYQLCDSLLLCNSISTMRNVDLLQAVSQGANNKKTNVKYGSFMVFLRSVAILYKNQRLFIDNFGTGSGQSDDGQLQKFMEIYQKINQGDVQKIKQKLIKILTKCYQNFSTKMNDDKKYEQKIQDIKITMSLSYGSSVATTSNSAVSSLQNLKNKNLKKSLSQVTSKIQTNNTRQKQPISQSPTHPINQKLKSTSTRTLGGYKILNPEQKLTKILSSTHNPTSNSLHILKKLIIQSIKQFQQCLIQQRFQLFYYTQIIQNFLRQYQPNQQTSDLISQYLLQILTKLSKVKHYATSSLSNPSSKTQTTKKIQIQSLRNILKICLCDLVLGNESLLEVLNGFGTNMGVEAIVNGLLGLDQMRSKKNKIKIKKKNKKCFLGWLDQHVPTDLLSDRLFEVMDKIQKGQQLGYRIQSDNEQQQSNKRKSMSRQTFGKQKYKKQQQQQPNYKQNRPQLPQIPSKPPKATSSLQNSPKLQKKITFNRNSITQSNNPNMNVNMLVKEKQKQKQKQVKVKSHHHKEWDDDLSKIERQMNRNKSQKQKDKQGQVKFNNKFLDQLYQQQQKKKNSQHIKKQQPPYQQKQKYQQKVIKYDTQDIKKPITIFSQLTTQFPRSQLQEQNSPKFSQNKIPSYATILNSNSNSNSNFNFNSKLKNIQQDKNILNNSEEISHIEYKEDQSVVTSGYGGSTDRQILSLNLQKQKKKIQKPNKNMLTDLTLSKNKTEQNYNQYLDGQPQQNEDYLQNSNYERYYNQYKLEQEKSRIKHHAPEKKLDEISNRSVQIDQNASNIEQDGQKDKIGQYKQYIKKIRETYLPKEYIQKQKQKQTKNTTNFNQNPSSNLNYSEQKSDHSISYSLLRKQQQHQQHANRQQKQILKEHLQQEQQQQQKNQQKYEYKYLNINKLMYMLKNTTNPYSHLRNQILLPFKKLEKPSDKQFFLKQFNLFITSLTISSSSDKQTGDFSCRISLPQPYNSLLLTIILLFSEISINRGLITPLQELYEYMASLVSTNIFIRTILGLFHSVIEQTQSNLRTFLITILTKSLSRLMPFCQDPIQILRDLGQFYNIGENVYFQMYEVEYRQICQVVEGPSLKDIVEKALIKQGENLAIIVESWFETKLKNKVKLYIKQIIEQNQQEDQQENIGDAQGSQQSQAQEDRGF